MAEPEKDGSWSFFKGLAPKLTGNSPYSLPRVLGLSGAPVVEPSSTSVPAAPTPTPSALRPIRTPHSYPASHPELAFSPTDVGIWEIHQEKRSADVNDKKSPSAGFKSWSIFAR